MNNIIVTRSLCITLLTMCITQAIFADFYKKIIDVRDGFHKGVNQVTATPSDYCSQYIQKPIASMSKKIAAPIPDAYIDIAAPLLGCLLYNIGKQSKDIVVARGKTENPYIKMGTSALAMTLVVANFKRTWNKDPYTTDWYLGNGINGLLLVNSGRSLYHTYHTLPTAQE